MNKVILFSSIVTLTLILSFSIDSAFAHPHSGQIMINGHTHQPQTEYLPLNGIMGIEKTTLFFHVDEENTLAWGYVEGKIANPVDGYSVIIQIYDVDDHDDIDESENYEQVDGESVGAVHFAQVSVDDNGNYKYKFRVLDNSDGEIENIFKGDYFVTIFKVVYSSQNNLV